MAFTQYSTVSVPEFKWFIDLGNGSNYTIAKLPNDFLSMKTQLLIKKIKSILKNLKFRWNKWHCNSSA